MSEKLLWAPWRCSYVTKPKNETGCVFCEKIQSSANRDNLVLLRKEHNIVIMNLYPYNNGHIMILPNRHVADITELTSDEANEMTALVQYMITVLRKAMNPMGFNIGINMGSAAGAGIAAHLHQHIVPRWNGDCNFMPVIGETKVISEHIMSTYDKIYDIIKTEMD